MGISYSRVSAYYNCPYSHYLSYNKKIKKIKKPKALFLGTIVHTLLEKLSNGENWLEELVKINNDLTAEDMDNLGLDSILYLEDTINAYIDYNLSLDQYTIVETEMKLEGKINGMDYVGYVDAVVKKDDKYYILEHKTSSSAFPVEATLILKEQPYIYAKLVGEKLKVNIEGIIWEHLTSKPLSAVKIKKDGEPYANSLNITPYMWKKHFDTRPVPETCNYDNVINRTVVLITEDKINWMFNNFVKKAEGIDSNNTVRLYDSTRCTRFCEFSEFCQYEARGLDTNTLMGTVFENKYKEPAL